MCVGCFLVAGGFWVGMEVSLVGGIFLPFASAKKHLQGAHWQGFPKDLMMKKRVLLKQSRSMLSSQIQCSPRPLISKKSSLVLRFFPAAEAHLQGARWQAFSQDQVMKKRFLLEQSRSMLGSQSQCSLRPLK